MSFIIMKYDDLSCETYDSFERVANYVMRNNYSVSMGLIGKSLEIHNSFFVEQIKIWSTNGIEIWNHGYYHTSKEFSSSSIEEQRTSILRTQELMKKKLGIETITFGSPHNNSTETTIKILCQVAPEIKNYLFAVDGQCQTKARQLLVRCNMEIKTGNIDWNYFIYNYNLLKDLPYFIIQGHPSYWGESDFLLNKRILNFLQDEGHEFVVPSMLKESFDYSIYENEMLDSLEEFAKSANGKLALFGAGQIGREIFRYLSNCCGVKPTLFVVSDKNRINEITICGTKVVSYDEFVGSFSDFFVIPTLMSCFHDKIIEKLERDKIAYFAPGRENEYLRMINIARLRIINVHE